MGYDREIGFANGEEKRGEREGILMFTGGEKQGEKRRTCRGSKQTVIKKREYTREEENKQLGGGTAQRYSR